MPQKRKAGSAGQLRIIGGQWRGRKLPIANVDGLRPTGDRVRETLFNWLMGDINGSHCLDLFAGSGALGLESLSRGAKRLTMLEKNTVAARQLAEHCQHLNAQNTQIIQEDALQWLEHQHQEKHAFDIVFIDPPFADNLWEQTLSRLINSELLAPKAIIYIEKPKGKVFTTPPNWQLHREKQTGNTHYSLYYS
ncbi:MAG: 16S rRNA (guanine(966)-N(2))-methyltransferase RsmD [Cellvibrionaceae bacterium]